jgi:hypothetical protein
LNREGDGFGEPEPEKKILVSPQNYYLFIDCVPLLPSIASKFWNAYQIHMTRPWEIQSSSKEEKKGKKEAKISRYNTFSTKALSKLNRS